MSSERRNHLILVALIVVALIGAALLAVPGSPIHKKPVLGLDLQGGLEVVLKAVPGRGETLQKADLERSKEIIRNRIDRIGVAEPLVRTQGKDQIAVEMPGVKNADQARKVIGQTAQLELYDLQPALTGPSVSATQGFQAIPKTKLYDLLASASTQSLVDANGAQAYYLFQEKGKKALAGPLPTKEAVLASAAAKKAGVKGEEVPKGYKVFALPNESVVIRCGLRADFCPGVGTVAGGASYYYLFKYQPKANTPIPEMTGGDLKLSGTRADLDPQSGQPIVLMQFTGDGAKKFHDITREEAQRGRRLFNASGGQGDPQAYNQNFAIVLDRELITAPSIDFNQYPDGISGGQGAQITGINSTSEAKQIALVLQTGALPVDFVTLSETEISATLGEDSLREAAKAAAAGLLIVAIFLLLFYRFLGLVAVIGLGIYAIFVYAAILIFNVTMTLPGFAGVILTIGVAADANIVIFERIKEESRAGKSVRAAVSAGYQKGFHTIVDANVVTAITALVLFVLATAGVKGFALMLLVGIVISMVTAVFATRAMLGLLAGFRWFDSPKFMGAQGEQHGRWMQIDFIGRRKLWFAISGLVLLIGAVSLGVRQLNLGIDFEGGTQISFTTPSPVALESVRSEAANIGQGGAEILGRGPETGNGNFREFELRTEALPATDASRLQRDLTRTVDAQNFGATTVSASFGSQIAKSAIWAVIFSLLLIVGYISMRFHWKYAVPVIVALIHDIGVTIGVYSVTGRLVTSATVAAILTVLGYSIYDTIIIFDRVRENIPLMRRATFPSIANLSLWEVMRRSLATTLCTLLPVIALFFFGGETLKDFAFALIVGITAGAYSSIFIAAPLLSWLKEREPEYMRRTETPTLEQAELAAAAEVPVGSVGDGDGDGTTPVPATPAAPVPAPADGAAAASKRDRRQQRRRTRPHGRAR